MESLEERKSRKTTAAIVGLVLILSGGAFFAYSQGLIPGFGGGAKTANELKAEIEALKGKNIETKVIAAIDKSPNATPEDKKIFAEALQSVQLDFQFADLKPSSGDGRGIVEIISPKLTITSPKDRTPGEIIAPKLVVARDVSDANHYYYHTEGDIEFWGEVAGTKSKLLAISGEQPVNEIRIGENGEGYYKSQVKNLKFIEGRGNTTLVTVTDASLEGSNKILEGGKVDAFGRISYKEIIPGDMIKLMVGDIQPITLNLDYAYAGDDVQKELGKLNSQTDPKMPPFDGDLKLNDFSLLMGDAGVGINANLNFVKTNLETIPTGEAVLKISQYQKLLDYAGRFVPVPQEEIAKNIQFLSQIGENANGNLTFKIAFDGTKNIKIGGKTLEEIEALHVQQFPAPVIEGLQTDATAPVPPAAVEAKPLPAAPTTTPTPKAK